MNSEPVTMPESQKPKREVLIDIIRGFAVLAMIITHVIALVYAGGKGEDVNVYNLGLIGGIFSFTAFLFISGASTYFSQLYSEDAGSRRKVFDRTAKLVIVYYLLSSASIFVNTTLYSFPPTFSWVETSIRTVALLIIPSFAEFLIPLILFSASIFLFKKFYRFLLRNPLIGMIAIVVSYALGNVLLHIDLNSNELNTLKAILAGHNFENGQLHTFPVLQYFSVFLLGMYFAQFLNNHHVKIKRLKLAFIWTGALLGLAFAGAITYRYVNALILYPLPDEGRFPPSITFLVLSTGMLMLVYFLFTLLYKLIPRTFKVFLHYIGINALEMLFFHTLVLFGYKYLTTSDANPNGVKHLTLTDIFIVFAIVLALSLILTSIKNSIKEWSLKGRDDDFTWWFLTERIISTLIFIAIFTIVGVSVYKDTFVPTAVADTSAVQFKKRLIREEDSWWNHDYKTKRQITITNNSSALPLFFGSWVGLRFNHDQAIGTKNATFDEGKDLRIVYFDKENSKYLELPFILEEAKTATTKISFKLVSNINPGEKSSDYYLYYGNNDASAYPLSKEQFSNPPTEDGIALGEETFHEIFGTINRTWFLKKKSTGIQAAALVFDVSLTKAELAQDSIVTYNISGTDKNGTMKNVGDHKFQAAVVVSDLAPGTYKIQASITDTKNNLKITRSAKIPFNISYPLYVAWTMDWEGWDVGQRDLNDIASIADANQIPITHFFNPRIYVKSQYTTTKISDERAKYLTTWVKERQATRFDEIGMHMHMITDMVSEAGVTAKSSPVIVGTYGFDVPTYVYTQDELEKIFRWGRQKMVENGLGAPISYRSGAWMSGVNVLKAAQNAGFLIDSSGRTGGPVNASVKNSTPVPWTLSETTKPYLPNTSDINTWTGTKQERLTIWEFPNNGADSYWFPASELIRRFDVNYPDKGSILKTPQAVNYLSHPHWFSAIDYWKIKSLFEYIKQFSFKDDRGPVVFSTLETTYAEWDKDNFFNGV